MSHWSDKTKGLVLFGLAVLIYGSGIGRGFIFDDLIYISENPLLRRADAFRVYWCSSEAFNYYPLFWSLLRVQWLLWGDHPLGYHLVTLLVHCVNAVLVWRVARAWRIPGAWWVGALFAVHPVNVQTIAWAAEQKNTWSFLFMALALLTFLRHADERDWRSYSLSLLCFGAALACKTSTAALPVFLAIYLAFPKDHKSRVLLLRLIPFFVLAALAGLTTIWFEEHRVLARSLISELSLWQRTEAAGATFWFYLAKALVPLHLTPMYRGWVDTTAAAHTAIPAVLLVLLLGGCALIWRRIGRPVALGITYYVLMMLPLLGIFDTNYFIYSEVADHWQYHALPGLLVAVVSVARSLCLWQPPLARLATTAGTLGIFGAATLASIHFSHFEDARTLWTYVVNENPEAWIAWYNLGNDYSDQREYAQAVAAYRESIRIKPGYYRAHFNIARALTATNRFEEADRAYLEAREMAPLDPDGYVNRGVLLIRMQREQEAIAEFTRALELQPHKASAEINLLALHLRRGRLAEASAYLPAAVADDANSHRLADLIAAISREGNSSREALQSFARRACDLSGGQRDLLAAAAALQAPTESGP